MSFKHLVRALLATLPLTVALPSSFSSSTGIEGYGIDFIQWEVSAFPGGPLMNITGTVEEVHDRLVQLNPDFDNDFAALETKTLDKRTDFSGSSFTCDFNRFPAASLEPIKNGIRYLRGVSGRPSHGPGPGRCGRVSCSYNAAIWWCNDSRSTKTLNSFASIADGAQFIVDRCSFERGTTNVHIVSGQVFHRTNWNVIVRSDQC